MNLADRIINFKKKIECESFTSVVKNSIVWHFDHWTNQCIMWLFKPIFTRCKLTDTIVIESHNDFDSNGGAFYDYLIKNGYNRKYRIVWMLNNPKPGNLPENVEGYYIYKPSIRKAYVLCTAKYLLSCHFIYGRMREGQVAFYLTHGSMGLKNVKGKIILPDTLDFVLVPSTFLAPILAEQYGLPYPNNLQKILGYPSDDIFYSDKEGDLRKVTKKNYRKVILWMPTFRKSCGGRNDSVRDFPLGLPILMDYDACLEMNKFLVKENVLLIIKIHPMQDLSTVKIQSLSNIAVLDKNAVKKLGIDNYHLMKDVDALISDYSSAAYDFLHADKPIGFTVDDIEDYNVGVLFEDPEKYMPGHIICTQDEFITFIEDIVGGKDPYAEKRKNIFDLFYKYHDGNSCQRLVEFLGLEN